MPGHHVDSPAGFSVMEGHHRLHWTDKGRKEGLEWLIDLSRVTSWTSQGDMCTDTGLPFSTVLLSATWGHPLWIMMDVAALGFWHIFQTTQKSLQKKSSPLTSDIGVAFAPGLISVCPYSQTLDHIALRKPYSLNISLWTLPSSHVDLWYSHLAGASQVGQDWLQFVSKQVSQGWWLLGACWRLGLCWGCKIGVRVALASEDYCEH